MFLLPLLALIFGSGQYEQNCDRIVITNNGPIRGTPTSEKKVQAYLGVPYAEPPVGELRFAKPKPKSSWVETYDADTLPPSCVQYVGEGAYFPDPEYGVKEDCLYLNLWVPEGRKGPKPIMVFIYGGYYMFGSSNKKIYDGAALSSRGDVIVATINYRVGSLGFFSAFISEAEGNMGMYDQIMAIQWIKDNARNFGGDPNNIVLFGESAGAFSVSLHMVSPLSKHLFKRGILQSGSAFSPMYSDNNEILRRRSQIVASTLGCADDNESLAKNPKEVVDCMKRIPAEKIAEADLILVATSGVLLPRVGDSFLPKNPIDLYKSGDFKSKDVLLGATRNEGSLSLVINRTEIFGAIGEKAENVDFNDTSSKGIFMAITGLGDEDSKVFDTYLDRVKEGTGYTYLDAMSDAVGDFLLICGAVFQADYQSKDIPVYFYLFDYRPPSSIFANWMGVIHTQELPYVFGNPSNNFTEFEEKFSEHIMDRWIAFAKTGNPKIKRETKWPRYTLKNPKYLVIGESDSVEVKPFDSRCDVWKNLFRY